MLASRNAHKLRELGALIAPHALEPLPAGVELPPELGTNYTENALGKARAAAAATGAAALGDDSGIEAAGLGGRPGIHSARFAGEGASDEQILAKLLAEESAADDARAEYVCVLALVLADGTELAVEGRCRGRRTQAARGAGGFGYDPAFVPDEPGDGRTMAELSPAEKDAVSHRGRAARALVGRIARMELA